MSTTLETSQEASTPSAGISIYDARPFFEKALQFGVQHGVIGQAKLDAISQEAPKGMVQIAAYFGSEFLLPELDRARDRIVNLVSLFLEEQCNGDVAQAAEWLRDHTFLSCSKGGSTMLKNLIAMPQTGHFGMNERRGFTDDHIPLLSKWSLRTLAEYRTELASRRRAAQVMDAALWLAGELRMDAEDLEDAGADAEAVIRMALTAKRVQMPNWVAFDKMMLGLRKDASPAARLPLPPNLPAELQPVVEGLRQSVLADLPKLAESTFTNRKLFNQSAAFMGRYFWVEDGLAEIVEHDRSASAAWKKTTAGHTDEGSLLTLFLCVATQSPLKMQLTSRTAATLIRKIRKMGLDQDLTRRYILEHAPMQHQEDYLALWAGFLGEALATLKSDSDHELRDALSLLRRECVVIDKA
jgi:hypothetical protein